jgi:hypothetical protein
MAGTLHEDQYTVILSHSVLRMKYVSGKVVEKIKTRVLYWVPFFPESAAVCYEIMCKNVVEPHRRPQMTIWRMLIACWITKATTTYSEYVLLQRWLLKRASVLRHTYIVSRGLYSCSRCVTSHLYVPSLWLPSVYLGRHRACSSTCDHSLEKHFCVTGNIPVQ